MKHVQQSSDFKVSLYFKPDIHGSDLRRAVCSCGWTGCWYADSDYVQRSFDRHAAQPVPRRDCGHAFTTVGPCIYCRPEPMESL